MMKENILNLAAIICAQNGHGIRDPKILDYLFIDAVQLMQNGERFTFEEIAVLLDASFKIQL